MVDGGGASAGLHPAEGQARQVTRPVWAGHLPECGPLLRLEKVEKVITEACFRK